MMSSPVGMFHSFHVLSSDAVAAVAVFGCTAIQDTDMACPLCDCRAPQDEQLLGGLKVTPLNGLGRSSAGQGVSPVDFFFSDTSFLRGVGSLFLLFSKSLMVFSRACTLTVSLSRSSRTSIFSFMQDSYLWRSSRIVGSYLEHWVCSLLMSLMSLPFSCITRWWLVLWKSRSFFSFSQAALPFSAISFVFLSSSLTNSSSSIVLAFCWYTSGTNKLSNPSPLAAN
mmetsp:Transcript_4241/g.7840  ORF Transcript_4241/g.7840 Transcript_4241/m.7840 type:complete len:225 (+) Transcript_4241:2446-3120(+)